MDSLDTVLSRVRDEYSPDEDAKRRVRTAIAASLAASAAVGSAAVGSAGLGGAPLSGGTVGTAAAASALGGGTGAAKTLAVGGSLLWVKAVVGVGLVAGLAVTGLQLGVVPGVHFGQSRAPSVVATPVAGSPAIAELARSESTPLASQDSALAVARGPETRSTEQLAISVAPRNDNPQPSQQKPNAAHLSSTDESTPTNAAAPSMMLQELSLLREASQALRAGRTAEARRALSEHKRRFPHSSLAQERSGLDVLASCSDGSNDRERSAAQLFVSRSPNSPLAESIKKRCLQ